MAHDASIAETVTNKLDNILREIDNIEIDLKHLNTEKMKAAMTQLFTAYVAIADCSDEICTVYNL